MNISIIGAGNGGHAMAGHFSYLGHSVKLYSRSVSKFSGVLHSKIITLSDQISASVTLDLITDSIEDAIKDCELIMVTTTADAHKTIAKEISPFVQDGQTVILNPGRTLGAIEFAHELFQRTQKRVYVGEAQSLIYACRIEAPGSVRIIGIKDRVLLSAYPSVDTDFIVKLANSAFNCFIGVGNVLRTSLENIGAIFHPSVIVFNAAAIERGNLFYFYNDMTPAIANFITKVDQERLNIGKAFGVDLLSVSDWISYAYDGVEGNTLLEKMRNNSAYYKILAPKTLYSRLLLEDIPTGVLPLTQLARLSNVPTPLLDSLISVTQALLGVNFYEEGRTLENLKLENFTIKEFLKSL